MSYRYFLCVVLIVSLGFSQKSQGGAPRGLYNSLTKITPEIEMPLLDIDALLQEDEFLPPGKPYRYGVRLPVDLSPHNSGVWETLLDGTHVWKLKISSQFAYAMNLSFDSFYLPENSKLFIYNPDFSMIYGAYTELNNNSEEVFASPLLKGDELIIEYSEPVDVSEEFKLHIEYVVHDYKDILNYSNERNSNRTCGTNVVCPEADPYENQINAVSWLDMGGYICTGSMLNNTAQDLTPYYITAWHCTEGENVNTFRFYFNYETNSCSVSSASYGSSAYGSTQRASSGSMDGDFSLLEITGTIYDSWDVYYAGWRRNTSAPNIASGVHHPGGDPKKIIFDNDNAYSFGSINWYGGGYSPSGSHWAITWDDGGTEGGSSGSPAYDNNGRFIGVLSGGGNECSSSSSSGESYYGKFSYAWNFGSNSSSRLKDWLDPNNTGIYTLDGTYDGATIVYGCTDSIACNYNPDATNNDSSCEYASGSCDCNENPTGNYCDCNYNVYDECGVCDGDGSNCSGSVTLSFSSIDGNAGTAEIFMQNDVTIAGFQFVINDSPNYLNLIDISGESSANYDFIISSSESGTVIGFSLTSTTIPAGSGALLIATFDNNNTDQIFDLCLSDPVFSDSNANGVSVTLGDCVEMDFSSSLLGDINDDGVINVLDVVMLVNIVLGIEDEIPAGDLNSDGVINVLDVVILVNLILGS